MCAAERGTASLVCALSAQPKPVRLHRLWTDYALFIYVIEKISNAECWLAGKRQGSGS